MRKVVTLTEMICEMLISFSFTVFRLTNFLLSQVFGQLLSHIFIYSVRHCCPNLTKLRKILCFSLCDIEFHENPFSCLGVVPCLETDRRAMIVIRRHYAGIQTRV